MIWHGEGVLTFHGLRWSLGIAPTPMGNAYTNSQIHEKSGIDGLAERSKGALM